MLDSDWLPLADGCMATGYSFECDIILPRHITRFDASGMLQWTKPVEISGPTQVPAKLLPGPDSTF